MVHENVFYLTVIVPVSTVGYCDRRHKCTLLELHTPNGELMSYKGSIHKESEETKEWFGT